MAETISGLKRTMLCADISKKDIGKEVVLMGWCHKQRDLGGLTFISLRDRSGEIQLVIDEKSPDAMRDKASKVRSEFVLAATGIVAMRSSPNFNTPTGEIEIMVSELRILSESQTPPFYIEENSDTNEALRLKYRYLDLRRPDMQRKIILRHKITKCARDFYNDNGFLDIETPILTKSTPEGARDYIVPSRVHPGKYFALPQSPQLFKQILMLSGYDRYMQIARCFRDEDLRADRQPEFTQIDVEMSFVDVDDVMDVNERFIERLFKDILDITIKLPLKRLTYEVAMERFGSDKPDLRFGMELINISDLVKDSEFSVFRDAVSTGGSVRLINVTGGSVLTRKEIDSLVEFVKTYKAKGIAWITCDEEPRGSILKFADESLRAKLYERANSVKGDMLLIIADKDDVVFDALGQLRCEVAKRLNMIDPSLYELLWVTEFPLFEFSEEDNRLAAKHHPFTSPMDEDIPLLDSQPLKVRSKAYDMVLNGCELGGGSIRIHDQNLQKLMLNKLGFTDEQAWERFGFLLKAFQYGVPPHGGLAFGLDRIVMLLTGSESIRDVIAFPKVQNSSCLMTDAPDFVDQKQLDDLYIMNVIKDERPPEDAAKN
ncbi:MAG: aspartate--tRNA ligase [Saccharofermentanales bacterium]